MPLKLKTKKPILIDSEGYASGKIIAIEFRLNTKRYNPLEGVEYETGDRYNWLVETTTKSLSFRRNLDFFTQTRIDYKKHAYTDSCNYNKERGDYNELTRVLLNLGAFPEEFLFSEFIDIATIKYDADGFEYKEEIDLYRLNKDLIGRRIKFQLYDCLNPKIKAYSVKLDERYDNPTIILHKKSYSMGKLVSDRLPHQSPQRTEDDIKNLQLLTFGVDSENLKRQETQMNPQVKERKKNIKAIQKREDYKELIKHTPLNKLEYHQVDGYYPFNEFKDDFLFYYYTQSKGIIDYATSLANEDIISLRLGIDSIIATDCKFLWLKDELLSAFRQTSIPPLAEIKEVVPIICLFPPLDSFYEYRIRYIKILTTKLNKTNYARLYDKERVHLFPDPIPPSDLQKDVLATTIRIYTTTYDFFTTFRGIDGVLHKNNNHIETGVYYEARDKAFINSVNDICFNLLLYLSTKPELIEAPLKISTKAGGKGFGKTQKRLFNPQVIGSDYRQVYDYEAPPDVYDITERHPTPRTHWRMGHWKRVAYGKGRTERRWQWIKPVLVNPGAYPSQDRLF
ncbi:hypothetical protein [Roseofilum sp. Guam]|uniref:hypothetical protein n=1 Tax=Roseofilum sp. Guam TaxID=2821502 RepID=UPI001B0E2484|nr:hypothetical protein [Roseofilum sp. Guam]MBP0027751.1 hypothetical protein [Roseofilum sp. Guam]